MYLKIEVLRSIHTHSHEQICFIYYFIAFNLFNKIFGYFLFICKWTRLTLKSSMLLQSAIQEMREDADKYAFQAE